MFVTTRTKTLFAFAVLMAAAGNLSACNTIEGAGRDIGSAGKAIEKTAGGDKE